MAKKFLILRSDRVAYPPIHYEEDALQIATRAALDKPGTTYKVVQLLYTINFGTTKHVKDS